MKLPHIPGFDEAAFSKYLKNTGWLMMARVGSLLIKVLVGFAGAAADAFALMERFEAKLADHQGSITRASVELAKDWRMDRMLRRLEAMLVAADREHLLLLSGTGEVIQPTDGIVAIGSGGGFALAAARALVAHASLSATDIVKRSLEIAGEICIYTNQQIVVEELA